jgi:hypothetical protein
MAVDGWCSHLLWAVGLYNRHQHYYLCLGVKQRGTLNIVGLPYVSNSCHCSCEVSLVRNWMPMIQYCDNVSHLWPTCRPNFVTRQFVNAISDNDETSRNATTA